ncbi:MAG: hypothetical protein MJ174_00140 [Treponema sp.]|nr:hypothetical protein [Treponema sp.]
MAKVTNYQCPACTGPLHFVGSSGKLECDYCGSSFEVSEIDAIYNEKVKEAKDEADKEAANAAAEEEQVDEDRDDVEVKVEGKEWNQDEIKLYNCSSCGAEIISEPNTVATSCPYCGNPTVIPGQFTAGIMPEKVIPFKYDKNAAINALKNHYKKKIFLPKVFSTENHIEEIKGIYVPFWLYEGEIFARVSMHGTRVHTHRSGDYEVIETDHYRIRRSGSVPFDMVPADGSEKMDDALMDSIEPFDYSELKEFTTSYLPGYYAESYDVSAEQNMPRLKSRIEASALSIMRGDVGYYNSLVVTSSKFNITKCTPHYVFMPVWLLNTKFNGKNYQFAMNGQTGKLVGNLPVSKGKFFGMLSGLTVGLTAVIAAIFYFTGFVL